MHSVVTECTNNVVLSSLLQVHVNINLGNVIFYKLINSDGLPIIYS